MRVVDLTHPLHPDFPSFDGQPALALEPDASYAVNGYACWRWRGQEHVGTHLDAPRHFDPAGLTVDAIPPGDLVGPAAVVDIRAAAQRDADARLTPDDLRAWEARHGPLPPGAIVLMWSGWDARAADARRYRNTDDAGCLHFPGFHPEAVAFLLEERSVRGIGVDSLSLDHGPSADFPVHRRWLGAGRWGLECVANLAACPPLGAMLVVGASRIAGGTGGWTRLLALLPPA